MGFLYVCIEPYQESIASVDMATLWPLSGRFDIAGYPKPYVKPKFGFTPGFGMILSEIESSEYICAISLYEGYQRTSHRDETPL